MLAAHGELLRALPCGGRVWWGHCCAVTTVKMQTEEWTNVNPKIGQKKEKNNSIDARENLIQYIPDF